MWPRRAPEVLEGSGVGTRGHAMQGGPDGVCGATRLAALMAGRKSRALGAEGSTPGVTPCLCPGSASTADRVGGGGCPVSPPRTHDLGEQRLGPIYVNWRRGSGESGVSGPCLSQATLS